MKLYLVRHSQTDYNLEHRHDHEGKAQLTESGKDRAQKLAQIFADKGISQIYSSPLQRCVDTVTPTAEKLGLDIQTDDRLREMFLGPLQDELWNNHDRKFIDELHNIENPEKLEGYEHMKDVKKRVSEFIDEIKEKFTNESVIICSHGGPLKNMISYLDSVPVPLSHAAVLKNTGITDEDAYIMREI